MKKLSLIVALLALTINICLASENNLSVNILPSGQKVIIKEVKSLIEESKHKIVSYVNTTLLFTYWNIGKKIIEYQGGKEKAKYGDKFIERLNYLEKEFKIKVVDDKYYLFFIVYYL